MQEEVIKDAQALNRLAIELNGLPSQVLVTAGSLYTTRRIKGESTEEALQNTLIEIHTTLGI